MTNTMLVVGAGVSGLAAAAELAAAFPTIVIDRLPVVGGIATGYEHPEVKALKRRCEQAGVKFKLGAAALRWSDQNCLLVAGPTGIEWLPGQHLIYAGGARPSTAAEMRIVGERLAGVVAATVAHHLLEVGVRLGERVVLIGNGDWAQRVAHFLTEQHCTICVVDPDNVAKRPAYADEWWLGWQPTDVKGVGRVREVMLAKDGLRQRIVCDAVILAARLRPMRNIDGAIFEDRSHRVTFAQFAAEMSTIQQRCDYARQAVQVLIARMGEKHHES